MDYCFYCNDEIKLNSLMIKIIELKYSIIFLNRNQYHKGRLIVAAKRHIEEFFEFTEDERVGFANDIAIAAKAIFELFEPKKINYATYGDKAPHFHVHLVPKQLSDVDFGCTFNDYLVLYQSEEEYMSTISLIKNKIEDFYQI